MADILSTKYRKPKITDYDGTDADFVALSGVSQTLFPDVGINPGVFQERFVYNPNALGSFWINIYGGVAEANGNDCIEVPPRSGWSGSVQNRITIIATAAAKITYGQR